MAISLLAELYDSQGEKIDESFFGSLQPVRSWAKDQGATFIKTYDVDQEEEKYYLKAGAQGRWNETTEKMFNFIINRNQEESEQ